MKKLMFLLAAVAMAVSAEAAKTVYAYYYFGDVYGNSGLGYVDPYTASVASSPVSFTVTNTPAGWKITDWLTAANTTYIRIPSYCTPQDVSSSTYTWTDFTSSTNALAVRFDPVSYTLNFDTADGTAFPRAGPYLSTNVVSLAEYTGTRTGYSFGGWTNSYVTTAFDHTETFAGLDKFGLGNADTNITLYAKWTANSYTALFDANGGSVSQVSKPVTYGRPYGTLPAPTWAGHAFAGWYYGGSPVAESTVVYAASDHTLTAHWSTDAYAVTTACEGSGSVSLSPPDSPYAYGTEVTATATPSAGWLFSGWKEDGSTENPRKVTVTNEISLTAVFTAKVYTVTFLYRNSSKKLVSETQRVSHGEDATPPSTEPGGVANSYPGHVFTHWDGSYTSITDNRTVTAVYDANVYTVEFAANGSGVSGSMKDQEFECGEEKSLRTNKYSRAGYTFSGWNMAADGSGNSYADRELVSDLSLVDGDVVTLYAQWAPISYSIEFVGGTGSSGSMPPISDVAYGSAVPLPRNRFAKAGYEFKYWKCGALEIDDGAVVSNLTTTADATVTLVATWSANAYWVAFDPNGGKGEAMAPQRFVYDQAQNLSSNTYSRGELWRFDGWSNTVDGTVFADGAAVSNLCSAANATNTLIAVWTDTRNALTKAMHCTNLLWENVDDVNLGGQNDWIARSGEGFGYNESGSCAEQSAEAKTTLTAKIPMNGKLSFYCRCTSELVGATLELTINRNHDNWIDRSQEDPWCSIELSPGDGWQFKQVEINVDEVSGEGDVFVHLCVSAGVVQIDQMTWVPVGSTVTFGKNGGTGGDDSVLAAYGAELPVISVPTKPGYVFDGYWTTVNAGGVKYYNADGTGARIWDKTGDVTLWAKWTNKVTFGKNGGTGGDNYVTCTKGQPMPKRTMPTKSGYVFDGYWNTTGVGGVKYYNSDGTSAHAWDKSGNVTLWAKWRKAAVVKVTLGKNNGSGGDNYVTCTEGQPMPTPRTAPKRTGWTFAGYWDTLAQDANGNPKGKQYYDANMKSVRNWDKTTAGTLWAKWTVRVKLGKNGGTGGDDYVTVTYNQPFPKRTMPKKTGYTFGGYYISSSSKTGQCYNADGTGTSSMKWSTGGSPTIWALWTKTSSSVEVTPPNAAPTAAAPNVLPAGLYSGVLADGSGTFCLMLDEYEEGLARTAFLYIASEDGSYAAECTADEADGVLRLATEDGEAFIFDPCSGELSR